MTPVDRSDPTGLVDRDVHASIWNRLRLFDNASTDAGSLYELDHPQQPTGVIVHWDITNTIRLVRNVTKRDGLLLVERGEPVAAGTRKDFSVTGEDAHNVTAHLSIYTQIATHSATKLTRWEVVKKEYENVQTFFDWASKGDGGYLARTAFRGKNYSSGQEAANGVYGTLAPSLENLRFRTLVLRDGPFGTHVPSD